MRSHDGRPVIRRTVVGLAKIAEECERRARGEPLGKAERLLGMLGEEARASATELAETDQRKQWVLAEVRRVRERLDERYVTARSRLDQLTAALVAIYGRSERELAAFGLQAPRGRRRIPAAPSIFEPPSDTRTAGHSSGGPATAPASEPAALPAIGTAARPSLATGPEAGGGGAR